MATYVLSDVHGAYNKFKKMLKKINFTDEDTLYILGDVIDRGKAPIHLLLDVMNRNNITLLLGNHEDMMLDFYLHLNYNMKQLWYHNGGEITDSQFKELSEDKQKEVLEYLKKRPVLMPISVNGKDYWLAHASYTDNPGLYAYKRTYYMDELRIDDMDNLVWRRDFPFSEIKKSYIYPYVNHATLITGHTPTWIYSRIRSNCEYNDDYELQRGSIFKGNSGHFIGIDCGCASFAFGNEKGRLGCLRLDDMKEFYV